MSSSASLRLHSRNISVSKFLYRLCNPKDVYVNKKSSQTYDTCTLHGIFIHACLARLAKGDSPDQLSYDRVFFTGIPAEVRNAGTAALTAFEDAKQISIHIFPRLSNKYEFLRANYEVCILGLRGNIDAVCIDKSTGDIVVVEFKTSLNEQYGGTRTRSRLQGICYCMMLHENKFSHAPVLLPTETHIITINWSPKSKAGETADFFSCNTTKMHTEKIGYYGKECKELKDRIMNGLYEFGYLSLSNIGGI